MTNLRIPGPTPCPPDILAVVGSPMIDHRGPEFAAMQQRIEAGLKPFFETEQQVLLLSCSGTGAMEAAVVNTLSPGDAVLAVSIGAFGDRFGDIAQAYGANVERLSFDLGQAANPDTVANAVQGGNFRAVLVTHNETSTGVTNPIEEIARAIRAVDQDVLILVDAVSSLGCVKLSMDAWDLDVVISGSQKGWLSPPGIAMAALSPRGWAAVEQAKMPRYYLDFGKHRDYAKNGQPPWTPALPAMFALDAALLQMNARGPEAIYAEHARFSAWARAAARAMGLEPFAADERYASNTVTALAVPEAVDVAALRKRLRDEHDTVIAGGQAKLAGKIVRLGHLGWLQEDQMAAAFEALRAALAAEGYAPAQGAKIPALSAAAPA